MLLLLSELSPGPGEHRLGGIFRLVASYALPRGSPLPAFAQDADDPVDLLLGQLRRRGNLLVDVGGDVGGDEITPRFGFHLVGRADGLACACPTRDRALRTSARRSSDGLVVLGITGNLAGAGNGNQFRSDFKAF